MTSPAQPETAGPVPRCAGGTGRAVVLGAGLAGLTSARVLAEHFDEVVLVERDVITGDGPPVTRPNVPQGHHVHGLLDTGRRALVRLFPGLAADIAAAGGFVPGGETGRATDPAVGDKYMLIVRGRSEIRIPGWWIGGVAATRVLLEDVVRRRVLALPQVTVVEGTAVTGLRVEGQGEARRVTGVDLTRDGTRTTLAADLVVDATGKTSKLPVWLEQHGFPAPKQSRVLSDVRYSSALLRPEPGYDPPWLAVLGALASSPVKGQFTGGVLLQVENGLLHLSIGTLGGEAAPTDIEGFRAYAEEHCSPHIGEAVRRSSVVGAVTTHRMRGSQQWHYERLRRPARGVVAVGDSVCAFNPVYGQGMSVAALAAVALGTELSRPGGVADPRFERRVARSVARAAAPAWNLALGEDLRFGVGTENVRGVWFARQGEWFRRRLERAAAHDPEVALAYGEVLHLHRTPAVFGTPRMLRRIWRPLRERHLPTLVELTPKLAEAVPGN